MRPPADVDEQYMARCLELAAAYAGFTSRLVLRAFPAIEEAAPAAGPIAVDQRPRKCARVG